MRLPLANQERLMRLTTLNFIFSALLLPDDLALNLSSASFASLRFIIFLHFCCKTFPCFLRQHPPIGSSGSLPYFCRARQLLSRLLPFISVNSAATLALPAVHPGEKILTSIRVYIPFPAKLHRTTLLKRRGDATKLLQAFNEVI